MRLVRIAALVAVLVSLALIAQRWKESRGARRPRSSPVAPEASRTDELADAGLVAGTLLSFDLASTPQTHYVAPLPLDALDEVYRRDVELVSGGHAVYDAWMGRAARELAYQGALVGASPPEAAVSFFLRSQGSSETSVSQLVVQSSGEVRELLEEAIERILASIPAGEGTPLVGIGEARIDAGRFDRRIVLLASRRRYRLEPTARRVDLGASWEVRGQFPAGFSEAHASVLLPNGSLADADIERDGDGFAIRIDAGDVPGTLYLSVDGNGKRGPEKLLQVQAEVGGPVPTHFDTLVPPTEAFATPEEAEAYALELLNRDREELGFAPLHLDPALAAIARAHSAEMRDLGVFGHLSSATGLAADRLATAHYTASVHGENLALNDTIVEAQASLLESVGHRRNIVEPAFTHVGIGVARQRDVGTPSGQGMWYLTQLFARPVPPLNAEEAALNYLSKVNRARQKAERHTMAWDESLSDFAEDNCDPRRASLDGFAASLAEKASDLAGASVAIHVQRSYQLSTLAVEGALIKDDYRRLGLALCRDPEDMRGATLVIAIAAAEE